MAAMSEAGASIEDLRRLCARHGIDLGYDDIWGQHHAVTDESLRALLRDAGVQADAPSSTPDILPAVAVVPEGQAEFFVPVVLANGARQLRWRLTLEDGRTQTGESTVDEFVSQLRVPFALPLGYHHIALEGDEHHGRGTHLICAPATCHQPDALARGMRLWGVSLQLYGLRSPRNWGIGDFGDLRAFAEQAAHAGASLLGLNPLHALFPHNPVHASPYSPSSRGRLNVLYIDVEAVPDFADCADAQALVRSDAFQARLSALRAAPLVDYPGVASAKHEVLSLLHERFCERSADDAQVRAFQAFCEESGQALHEHALFEAVQAHWHRQDASIWGWPAWPKDWQDMRGAAVQAFVREHARDVQFYTWLQWQAARQLQVAGEHCRALGMPIGLYLDLAVSVDRGGSDAWRHRDAFALGASIGAPPDLLNLQGQDWGLPPLRPDRLRETGFAAFVEALRANMRSAGALRIDHVMMLMRLFWIPGGMGGAADGAYVRYPWQELFAVLALESRRHRCLVVGEDLGTVPDAMRDAMRRHGVLSYRLLYFQRDDAGQFLPPDAYPRDAVVAVSTHDLPSFAGWWNGADLDLREQLGMAGDPETIRQAMGERGSDRERLAQALGLPTSVAASEVALAPQTVVAAHAFLARAPSSLMMVQLEDLLGQGEQANLPGTVHEHPNWRRKYALEVQYLGTSPLARALADAVDQQRSARPRARIPRATYRLQLHKDFDFDAAGAVVPYLAQLGVSHVYCSPIQRARSGSLHGYDVVAHDQINPELGGMGAYRRFADVLRANGMRLLVDVVPNHMGVLGSDNAWWNDVLEHGMNSAYAEFFDIDWASDTPGMAGKVLLPVLGDAYGRVLERGELQLDHEAGEGTGRWVVRYYDHRFPVSPASVPAHLQAAAADRGAVSGALDEALAAFNTLANRDEFHALLEAQAWRLAHWRCAADEINYRRFFDVNELAALRTEREDVFEATHALPLDLAAQGDVDGLRIDHPDGLLDPAGYFDRLQAGHAKRHAARGEQASALYVVAEKIAAAGEDVPLAWAIHGTTGYRFANVANGVLVDHRAASELEALWREFTGLAQPFEEVVYASRLAVATGPLAADLDTLANALAHIAKSDWRTRDHTRNRLREAIAAVAAAMPVYRSYNGSEASEQDIRVIDAAVDGARARMADNDEALWRFLREALLGRLVEGAAPRLLPAVVRFARRFQQYSAPVAAKGVEDTAFYRYFPLSSVNEVGGEPDHIGMAVEDFHVASLDRQRRWPYTMLATSTHDNKRSEDVRLRINLLSECPDAWRRLVLRWKSMHAPLARGIEAAHQYLLYQTLVGVLPADGAAAGPAVADRVVQYMFKAAREAKTATSWTQPDPDYEAALERFVREALDDTQGFGAELSRFVAELDPFAAVGALSLSLLKFTSPGVPDIYQGCELIEHSLVDPDNRRPVDYDRRSGELRALGELAEGADVPAAVAAMAARPSNGRAKLWAIWRLLALRRRLPDVFLNGSYEALAVEGERAAHAIAYLRRYAGQVLVVVMPRLQLVLAQEQTQAQTDGAGEAKPLQPVWSSRAAWGDTRVVLPADLHQHPGAGADGWQDVLTTRRHSAAATLALADLFAHFPGAVLVGGEG
ncbi:malto-oligosyltrehalose synthase [Variovorax dokdonensis]|uniref:4-alpha-glucanotransferase n=1 Tax=Variovorax dokdonensis TaxID=344883 RepID=A0ABT7N600_9BURK|nr:malto-oligosyltrehalose synthase [Variovorax dokdonensis]MDM0043366.1 malto-oligosyltrehalose synthase [Variovorax dokdonensis]